MSTVIVTSCRKEAIGIDIVCDKDKIVSPYLVNEKEAKDLITIDSNIIVIEVSDALKFEKEHIPNAINIWRPNFTKSNSDVKGLRATKKEIEELLSSLGVQDSSTLLIYDTKGSVDAFRFTWVLDFYGFKNYKVLNGGLQCWKNAGFATTADSTTHRSQTNFSLKEKIDSSLLASFDDVKVAISDPSTIIIDTRESYEYLGQPFIADGEIHRYKKGAFMHGCIPTAVHLNWSDLSDLGDDHRIKCEKDLRYNLKQIGVSPDKKIIVYCQSGSRSSHTAFVLREILKYPNVKNYDGSWIEWSQEYVKNGNVEIEQKTKATEIDKIIADLELKLKNER